MEQRHDPRIGKLMVNGSIVHYAFVEGKEVRGSLEQVEVALGLRAPSEQEAPAKKKVKAPDLKKYEVVITTQYPSALTPDAGRVTVYAKNAKSAISNTRKLMAQEGQFGREDGKITYKAVRK